ncbi:ester cyclase [Bradyrhizobium septentrionale]|uniref:Nuclear transport factor 2 family protein n=1 Tax=Bradyrhizobium septentrionale TaxID=1404411 RepID=A0A973W569_9BRAD|nr:nuclear transport factor 2 family protein [Bradyrhizobium septentrionale]UGY16295.1 ester cyclase [Bradyrhizobium septentrionale]UGY24923.1 ester cyclase [Bradyrhizobium septentrionale]
MNVEQVARHWLDQLQKPNSDAFARLFTQNGRYIDPAFGLARQGRDFVRLHHKKWHAAVPDFRANVERVLVDGQTAVIQYEATGTFDGEPLGAGENAIQPTHKRFKARVVIVLDLDDDGQVKTCTEYYDRSIMPDGATTPYADDPRGLQ